MIIDLAKTIMYVRPGWTDMRKAINGLSMIVQEDMGQDPFTSQSVSVLQPMQEDSESPVLGPERILPVAETAGA